MASINLTILLTIALTLSYNVYGRPADLEDTTLSDQDVALVPIVADPQLCSTTLEDDIITSGTDEVVKSERNKRSAEDSEDLETAAGTNVLRPLFVYRQQLAYRERVKGAVRRSGIRPRF